MADSIAYGGLGFSRQRANVSGAQDAPNLVSLSPSTVAEAGGASIALLGYGFTDVTAVLIDGVEVGFVVANAGKIEVVTPAGTGSVNVTVVTSHGSDTLPNGLTYGFAGAAPDITSVSPTALSYSTGLQDPAGGTDIAIVGTDFVNGCTCEFKQSGITIDDGVVVFNSSTSLTVTTPALAAGIYDVVITNPDTQDSGASGDGLHESWDPTEETWGLLLMPGDYSVVGTQTVDAVGTWADSSGNNRDATNGVANSTPADDGDGNPAFVSGDSLYLQVNESIAEGGTPMASLTAGTIIVGFTPKKADADVAQYLNAGLVAGSSASPTVQYSAKGFKASTFDELGGVYVDVYAGRARCAVKHVGFARWDGNDWATRVNGNAFVTDAITAGTLSNGNVGANTIIGQSFGGAGYFQGTMNFVAITDEVLSNDMCSKVRAWMVILGHAEVEPAVDVFASALWGVQGESGVTIDTGVGQWANQGGVADANRDLTNATDAEQPTLSAADSLFYDKDVVNFAAGPHILSSDTWASPAPYSQPFTTFFVANWTSQLGSYLRDGADPGGANRVAIYDTFVFAGSSLGVTWPTSGETFVACIVWDGASSEVYINDHVTESDSGDTGSNTLADVRLGARYDGTEPADCKLATMFDHSGVVSAANRKLYMLHLASKYGVPVPAF